MLFQARQHVGLAGHTVDNHLSQEAAKTESLGMAGTLRMM